MRRPTWRQMYDFAPSIDARETRGPCRDFVADATLPALFPRVLNSAQRAFLLFGASGTGASSIQLFSREDVDFFEGEASVIRMMGNVRLHYCTVEDNAGGQYTNRQVEVRCWIYKTWEQDINERVGLVHPFNFSDFDARILWSATWLTNVEAMPVSTANQGISRLGERLEAPAAAAFELERGTATAATYGHANRRFNIRQAVKVKGNERIALVLAAGPFPEVVNEVRLWFSGTGRMLVKH